MQDFPFENLLTAYRTRIGWTQPEVAEALEVSLRTYQGWENGERLPSNIMLQRLAILFELNDAEADQLYRAAAQVAPELENLPFLRNPLFTGRETYLEQLDHDLGKSGTVAITQPISISGLGGIGKTQLALEYAHRSHPERYRTILWVNAANKVTLEESYLSVARLLKLPQRGEQKIDDVVQAVKRWLGDHIGWLLILDNADDLQLARTFLPAKPRGHILLTTRSQILGNIAASIVLETMEPEEGLVFLLRRSGVLRLEAEPGVLDPAILKTAEQLVELLGGHPLALDQAGAYIEETKTSFEAYVQLYDKQRRILLERRGSLGDEHPETVVVTFEVCFERACEVCPLVADVLSFCAFLSPDTIPEEVLGYDDRLKLSSLEFDEAIGALRRYSLIRRNTQEKVLSVHRLVQAVRKDSMSAQTMREWAERVVLSVNAAFPDDVEYATWAQCERLLPHALICAMLIEQEQFNYLEAARLLHQVGEYLYYRGRYAEAEPLSQRALAIREHQLGPDDRDTARSLNNLAELYYNQGKYTEAEPLYLRALAIWERQPDPDHSDMARSLNNLAELYREQSKYTEAEPLYQHAISIWEQQLGPEHPLTASSLNNLAELYLRQGKYTEAEPLSQRALAIRERQLGPDHPDTARSLNNLANLYWAQKKYVEAEPLYQRALAIREQQLSAEHPDTAESLNNLATLYWAQAKYAEAEPLLQRALAIREQQLGAEHPDTAWSVLGLARLARDQGNAAEAKVLYERALSIFERQLGKDHPDARSLREEYGHLVS
jgi:tetratricopeptide (TPR) repeat protein